MINDSELDSVDYTGNIREESYGRACLTTGIILIFIIIAYLSYTCLCKKCRRHRRITAAEGRGGDVAAVVAAAVGIDEAILTTFPKLEYSKKAERSEKYSIVSTGCCICLEDYKERDVVSVLPDCDHFFHLKCINPWLRLHPSCPVCRKLPSLSPPPLPHAEAAVAAEV